MSDPTGTKGTDGTAGAAGAEAAAAADATANENAALRAEINRLHAENEARENVGDDELASTKKELAKLKVERKAEQLMRLPKALQTANAGSSIETIKTLADYIQKQGAASPGTGKGVELRGSSMQTGQSTVQQLIDDTNSGIIGSLDSKTGKWKS